MKKSLTYQQVHWSTTQLKHCLCLLAMLFSFSSIHAQSFTVTNAGNPNDAYIDLAWDLPFQQCINTDNYNSLRVVIEEGGQDIETVVYQNLSTYYDNALPIKGTFRHDVGPAQNKTYTLRFYANGQLTEAGGPGCDNQTAIASTLPFQAPTLVSVSTDKTNGVLVGFTPQSSLDQTQVKLFRGTTLIHTFDNPTAGNPLTYLDKFEADDANSLQEGVSYNYSLQTVSSQAGGGTFTTSLGTGKTVTINLTATDLSGNTSGKVIVNWMDLSAYSEIAYLEIRRKTPGLPISPLAQLTPTTTTYTDNNPIPGLASEYILRLIDNEGNLLLLDSDLGGVVANGVISGRVVTEDNQYPVNNVVVTATSANYANNQPASITATTNSLGEFVIDDLVYGAIDNFTITAALNGHTFTRLDDVVLSLNKPVNDQVVIFDNTEIIVNNNGLNISSFVANPIPAQDYVALNWQASATNFPVSVEIFRNTQLIYTQQVNSGNINGSFEDKKGVPNALAAYKIRLTRTSGTIGTTYSVAERNVTTTFPAVAPVIANSFTATANANSGYVTLEWNHTSSNHDAFRILRNGEVIANLAPDVFSYNDLTGEPGQTFTYSIQPLRKLNNRTYATLTPRTAQASYPTLPLPFNMSATVDASAPAINLAWEVPNGLSNDYNYTGYNVYRIKGGEKTIIKTVYKTDRTSYSFVDTEGIRNTVYDYEVRTFKATINKELFESGGSITSQLNYPKIPTPNDFVLAGSQNGEVILELNSSSNNILPAATYNYDGFELKRNGVLIKTLPALITDASIKDYPSGTGMQNFTYELRAYKTIAGIRQYSDARTQSESVTFGGTDNQLTPTNFTASDNLPNQVYMTWTYPEFLTSSFEIYRDGVLLAELPVGTRNHCDFTAEEGVFYDYTIKAFNAGDISNIAGDCGRQMKRASVYGMVYEPTTNLGVAGIEIQYSINGSKFFHHSYTDSTGFYFIDRKFPNEDGTNIQVRALAPNRDLVNDVFSTTLDGNTNHIEHSFVDNVAPFQFASENNFGEISVVGATTDFVNQRVFLHWNLTNTDYDGIEIIRGLETIADIEKSPGNPLLFVDSTGAPGITYLYQFKLYKNSEFGKILDTKVYGYRLIYPGLEPVRNLSADVIPSENKVRLKWTHKWDAHTRYLIYANEGFVKDVSVGEPNFYDDFFGTPDELINYKVVAMHSKSDGNFFSNEKTVTVQFPKVGKVENLTLDIPSEIKQTTLAPADVNNNYTLNSVGITWDYATEAIEGFRIYRNNQPIAELPPNFAGQTYYDKKGIPGEAKYDVSVLIERDLEVYESDLTRQIITYPDLSAPYRVGSTPEPNFARVYVEWRYIEAETADGFYIYRSTDDDFGPEERVATISDFTGNDTQEIWYDVMGEGTAIPGQVYYYGVQAFSIRQGTEVLSAIQKPNAPITFPELVPVTNVQATDGTHPDRVVVTWDYPETVPVDQFYILVKDFDTDGDVIDSNVFVMGLEHSFTDAIPEINNPASRREYFISAWRMVDGTPYTSTNTPLSARDIGFPSNISTPTQEDFTSTSGSNLGEDLDIEGRWMIASDPLKKEVKVYYRECDWILHQTLTPSAGEGSYGFSADMGNASNLIVVGAPYLEELEEQATTIDERGYAFVYRYNETTNLFEEKAVLVDGIQPATGGTPSDSLHLFGYAVAVDGSPHSFNGSGTGSTRFAVSNPRNQAYVGKVMVFEYDFNNANPVTYDTERTRSVDPEPNGPFDPEPMTGNVFVGEDIAMENKIIIYTTEYKDLFTGNVVQTARIEDVPTNSNGGVFHTLNIANSPSGYRVRVALISRDNPFSTTPAIYALASAQPRESGSGSTGTVFRYTEGYHGSSPSVVVSTGDRNYGYDIDLTEVQIFPQGNNTNDPPTEVIAAIGDPDNGKVQLYRLVSGSGMNPEGPMQTNRSTLQSSQPNDTQFGRSVAMNAYHIAMGRPDKAVCPYYERAYCMSDGNNQGSIRTTLMNESDYDVLENNITNVQASDGTGSAITITFDYNVDTRYYGYDSKPYPQLYRNDVLIGDVSKTDIINHVYTQNDELLNFDDFNYSTTYEDGPVGVPAYYSIRAVTPDGSCSYEDGDSGYRAYDGMISGDVYAIANEIEVDVEGITMTATAVYNGSNITRKNISDVNGDFSFNNLPYLPAGTTYELTASFPNHEFDPVTRSITLSGSNKTSSGNRFEDITAYFLEGHVTREGQDDCGLKDIAVILEYKPSSTNVFLGVDTVLTNAQGMYRAQYDALRGDIQEVRLRIAPQQLVDQEDAQSMKILYDFQPKATTPAVISLPVNITQNVTTVDFEDVLKYNVPIQIETTCGDPISNNRYVLKIFSPDESCFIERCTTNTSGFIEAELPPLNLIIRVEDVLDNPSEVDNIAVDYFSTHPERYSLGDLHEAANGELAMLDPDGLKLIFHRRSEINIANTTMTETLCNTEETKVIKQGDSHTLEFTVSEDFGTDGNPIICQVQQGYLLIYNPTDGSESSTRIDIIDGDIQPYRFTARNINPFTPHTFGIHVQYFSQGENLLQERTIPVVVLGSSALPGSNLIIEAGADEAGQVKMPLFILRDPPGDGSFSTIENEASFSAEISFDKSSDTGGGFYSSLDGTIGGTGGFYETEIVRGNNNEGGTSYSLGLSVSEARSTLETEDFIGRQADIIVGTGFGTRYGLTQVLEQVDCDSIEASTRIGLDISGIEAQWEYTVGFIESLIDNYRRDSVLIRQGIPIFTDAQGRPLDEDDAIQKVGALIKSWEEVIEYHSVKTLPHYVLCADESYKNNLTTEAAAELDNWRAGFCSLIGTGLGNDFVLDPNFDWLQDNRIRKYNNTVAAVELLKSFGKEGTVNEADLSNNGIVNPGDLSFSPTDMNAVNNSATSYYQSLLGTDRQPAELTQFSGGVAIEKSFTTQQTSSTSKSTTSYVNFGFTGGYYSDQEINKVIGPITIKDITYEFKAGAVVNVETSTSTTRAIESENSTTISYTIYDDDPEDAHNVLAIQGPQSNQTPFFLNLGGITSCPPERATSIYEGADPIQVHDFEFSAVENATPSAASYGNQVPAQYGVPANDEAIFHVRISNNNVNDDYNVIMTLDPTTNLYGARVRVGNQVLDEPRDIGELPAGGSRTYLIYIQRPSINSPFYNFDDLRITLKGRCDSTDEILDLDEEELSFTVHFETPCTDVSLTSPIDNFVVRRQDPNDENSREKILFTLRDYDSDNPNLESIELQYRRLGTGNSFQPVPGGFFTKQDLQANDATLAADQAPVLFYDWDITNEYATYPDGDYEVRAELVCGGSLLTYSNSIEGVLQRSALDAFGTPEPADGIWILGDEISATYLNDLDCALLLASPELIADNFQLVVANTTTPVPFSVQCRDNKIVFLVENMESYDGQSLTAHYKNIQDITGNQADDIAWTFKVVTQVVDWKKDKIELTIYDDEVITKNVVLINTTNDAATNLNLQRQGDSNAWLTFDPAGGFSVPDFGRAISFTFNGNVGQGIYNETILVNGVNGRKPSIQLTLNVVARPPANTVNLENYANRMLLKANWSFETFLVNSTLETSTDTLDQIRAFIGGEMRGSAFIKNLGSGNFAAEINIGGHAADEDAELTFAIWNADEGIYYQGFVPYLPITFKANTIRGRSTQPEILLVNGTEFTTVLPIELLYFRAEKAEERALLSWETLSEKDLAGFFIEHSTDGNDFEIIGWMDAKGNSTDRQHYEFVHPDPVIGINYYRLVSEDGSSKLEESDIRTVVFAEEYQSSFLVYPNPSKSGQSTFLKMTTEQAQTVEITVYDATGKQVQQLKTSVASGDNDIRMADQAFVAGMYFIKINHAKGSETLKMLITQ